MASRDPIGVCPLYYGNDSDGAVWFASEMKVCVCVCVRECGNYFVLCV